jgi:aerobic-type carbon monoxide dehydrogenase small subunit (CoxS/CutS family)
MVIRSPSTAKPKRLMPTCHALQGSCDARTHWYQAGCGTGLCGACTVHLTARQRVLPDAAECGVWQGHDIEGLSAVAAIPADAW